MCYCFMGGWVDGWLNRERDHDVYTIDESACSSLQTACDSPLAKWQALKAVLSSLDR